MAIVQVSVFEAVNAITGRYPASRAKLTAAPGASVDAAVAAATRTALLEAHAGPAGGDRRRLPGRCSKPLPDGPAKTDGIAVGEQAATAIVASCADDGAVAPDTYRPHTTARRLRADDVPGGAPLGQAPALGDDQRRPVPPGPAARLTSDTWTRDFNEIKALGGKNSTQRTPEQTAIAQFWEATAPAVYWPVARSVAAVPGRDVTDNARLLALAAMAMDDALIAVFDAKYTYNFWRPVTAIRNGDSTATMHRRDPGWTPFIDTPMHPEYPCAHCIVSASLGAVLAGRDRLRPGADAAARPARPRAAPCARGPASATSRRRSRVARIYDGVHYRNSTEVGTAMGKKIGELAVKSLPKATR